jgi:Flp pilus assembly protein TadG
VRSRRRDEGATSLEMLVVGAPAMLLFLAFFVAAGRISTAGSAVEGAARDAARTASLDRFADHASEDANATARQSLDAQDVKCQNLDVGVDTSGFAAPLGAAAHVTVTISCTVPLADLVLWGTPGSKTLTATFSSPLDPYRAKE